MRARRKQSRVNDSITPKDRKNGSKQSLLGSLDSNFKDIEQNFAQNPLVENISPKKESRSKPDQKQIKRGSEVGQNNIKSRSRKKPAPSVITESRSKVGSKVDHEVGQKRIKSRLEVGQKTPISLIVGLQKRMLNLLFDKCLQEGSKTTNFLGIYDLALALETNKNSIKSGIRQLRMKGAINKSEFKDGRSGGTKYTLPDHTYNEMLQSVRGSKVDQNSVKSRSKVGSKVGHKVDQNLSSSNSSNINTITTKNNDLDEIQIPELLKKKGFGLSHLKQMIQRFEFEVGEIQQFLEAYAFDLQGEQGKRLEAKGTNLIGYFFGALKNGGYNPVSKDFKTSEDQAMEDQLKALEERKRIREEREARVLELKFEEWLAEKGRDELEGLVPITGEYLGQFHKANLKDYYQR
ncbi:MAG: hypothetical protein DRQ89_13455, partial [Epsilonproteobacteria bacterium]